jgi:hypothetical protein
MPARRSQPALSVAGVFDYLGPVMRGNGFRIIFGLLLGVLAAVAIGALPRSTAPPKTMELLSSAFALRFSPALPAWISTH